MTYRSDMDDLKDIRAQLVGDKPSCQTPADNLLHAKALIRNLGKRIRRDQFPGWQGNALYILRELGDEFEKQVKKPDKHNSILGRIWALEGALQDGGVYDDDDE